MNKKIITIEATKYVAGAILGASLFAGAGAITSDQVEQPSEYTRVDSRTAEVTRHFDPKYTFDVVSIKPQISELDSLISKGGTADQMTAWTNAKERLEADLAGAANVGVEEAINNNEEIIK